MDDPKTKLIRGFERLGDGLVFWGLSRSGTERWVNRKRFLELELLEQEAEDRKREIESERKKAMQQSIDAYRPKTKKEKADDRIEYIRQRRRYDLKFRESERLRSRL